MEIENKRKKFVQNHMVFVFEKEKQEKLLLQENIQKLRTSNTIKDFIYEKLDFVFENDEPCKNLFLTSDEILSKFNTWFKEKNGFDHGIKDFHLYLEFQDVKYLGPANENKWYGITFQN